MFIDHAGIQSTLLMGKVAIVTGAGQGIGRETARILAHIGATVVIAEIRKDSGKEAESQIRAEGGSALFIQTDVADHASVERLRQQIHERFGTAHILVNNAEAFLAKSILDHTLEEWENIFAVNMRGAFLGIRAFLPDMLKQKDGVILTMMSADGMPYLGAYLATKVGLRSLALSLAAEVGDDSGVSVYCFGPGMVDTPAIHNAVPQLAQLYGVAPAEFIRNSAPNGELISAELCATGLVGSILHARDFHGQPEVMFSHGLQKLGLNGSGERLENEETPQAESVSAGLPTGGAELLGEALRLNCSLEEILRTMMREYEDLTVFQRPIVKRMFQQGVGMKLEEWLANAQEMTRRLRAPSAPASQLPGPKWNEYISQVKRLSSYFQKQEVDARGWFKDAETLKMALQGLRERKATTDRLASVLAALVK